MNSTTKVVIEKKENFHFHRILIPSGKTEWGDIILSCRQISAQCKRVAADKRVTFRQQFFVYICKNFIMKMIMHLHITSSREIFSGQLLDMCFFTFEKAPTSKSKPQPLQSAQEQKGRCPGLAFVSAYIISYHRILVILVLCPRLAFECECF